MELEEDDDPTTVADDLGVSLHALTGRWCKYDATSNSRQGETTSRFGGFRLYSLIHS
jgi:hypothetical protein